MKVENKTKKTVTSALFYVLYIALAVVFLAPLLFLFVSSVKSETQLVSDMATLKAFIPACSAMEDQILPPRSYAQASPKEAGR